MKRNRLGRLGLYIFIIMIATATISPIYWIVATSLKSKSDIYSTPPIFIPSEIKLDNYIRPFVNEGFTRFVVNSLIVSLGNMLLIVPLAFLAAYGLSRYRIYGSGTIFFWALTCRMAPAAAFIVPFFLIFSGAGLFDTHLALILVYALPNMPFALWLMKSGIDAIPREIDEASLVDGCSLRTSLRKIVLPLCTPSLAATALMAFVFSWNEYLFAASLTGSIARTIPTGLQYYITHVGVRYGEMAAVSVVCFIPTIVLIVLLQRYIISGLTLGAVKG